MSIETVPTVQFAYSEVPIMMIYSANRIRDLQQEIFYIKKLNDLYKTAHSNHDLSRRANDNRRSRLMEIKEELGAMMKAMRE